VVSFPLAYKKSQHSQQITRSRLMFSPSTRPADGSKSTVTTSQHILWSQACFSGRLFFPWFLPHCESARPINLLRCLDLHRQAGLSHWATTRVPLLILETERVRWKIIWLLSQYAVLSLCTIKKLNVSYLPYKRQFFFTFHVRWPAT
jgi:hypothetical protein